MGATTFNFASNPELKKRIDLAMRKAMYFRSSFAPLIAPNFLEKSGRKDEVEAFGPEGPNQFVGAPIETINTFIQEGRTDVLIPVKYRLTGKPIFGDMPLAGSEEAYRIAFRSAMINRSSKAVAPPNGYEKQKVKMWAKWLVNSAVPDLKEWFQGYLTEMIYTAFFFGYSADILAAAANGGLGTTAVSHPNLFVAGSGEVGYSAGYPGSAAYEAAIEAAINALSGLASQEFSPDFIGNLVQEAPRKKIKPIASKSGFPLYPLFCTTGQFNQLRRHADYKNFAESLQTAKMEEHPLANLGQCIVQGALIIPDLKGWAAYTSVLDANIPEGTVEYGPRPTAAQRAAGHYVGDTFETLDDGDNACCVLIGESALTIATGEEIEIKENVEDYQRVKGYGIDFIKSTVRNEIYDTLGKVTGTANRFIENNSSLMGVTYSPYALSYT